MQNSNVSDASFKTALIALGATAFGALVMKYAWDRYQDLDAKSEVDSASWFQQKRVSGPTKLKSESVSRSAKMTPMPEPASKPLVSDRSAAASISSSASSSTASTSTQKQQQVSSAAQVKTAEKSSEFNTNEGKVEERTTVRQGPVLVSGNERHQKAETTVMAETVRREVKEHLIHEEQRTLNVLEVEGNRKVREREAVVQEVVHPVEVEEIQPVIHRERKRTEVHQIIQPIYEEKMLPSQEAKRELIPEHLPTEYESREEYIRAFEENLEESSVEYAEAKKITLMKPAVIEEIVKTDIIEVIQPVIHRETIAPTVIKTTKPIYEKIKEQPTLIREVREPITLTSQELALLKGVTELLKEEQELVEEEEEIITTKTTTVVTTEVTKDVSEKKILLDTSSSKSEEIVQSQTAFSAPASVFSK